MTFEEPAYGLDEGRPERSITIVWSLGLRKRSGGYLRCAVMSATKGMAQRLVASFPRLQPALLEHLSANDELLPHVFMGDVARHVTDSYLFANACDGSLRALLDWLEEEFAGGGAEKQELLAVSFVESLPRADEQGRGIVECLGPRLRAEADRL